MIHAQIILIISALLLLLLACIVSIILNKRKSELITALNSWISAPEAYQDLTAINENIRDLSVNTRAEAETICRGLEHLKAQFGSNNYSHVNENLYTLAVLFQQVKSKQAYRVLNDRGIPLLVANFNLYRNAPQEEISKDCFHEPDIFMLKMFAQYSNPVGTKALIDAIKSNYKPDHYLWSVIFEIAAENDQYHAIIQELGDFLPA